MACEKRWGTGGRDTSPPSTAAELLQRQPRVTGGWLQAGGAWVGVNLASALSYPHREPAASGETVRPCLESSEQPVPAGAVGRGLRCRLAECDWAWLIREPPEIDVRRNLTRQRGLDTQHPRPDIHAPALLLLPSDNRERISNAPFIASFVSFYFSPSRRCVFLPAPRK